MAFDLQGYAILKNNVTTVMGMGEIKDYRGVLRCMEINPSGDVLVIDSSGTQMASFDKKDVANSFRCSNIGGYLVPPIGAGVTFMDQLMYSAQAMTIAKGDARIFNASVIAASMGTGLYYMAIFK